MMKIFAERPDLNQNYINQFKEKNFHPFNKITRVLVNSTTGEIIEELNELDSRFTKDEKEYKLDERNHEIMVKIPSFFAKRNWNENILTDSFIADIPPKHIDEIPKWIKSLGFQLFDCFVREDGSIRPYILIGAFEASEIEGKLKSLPYQIPVTRKNLIDFRRSAKAKGKGWEVMDFNALSCIQFLYKISFQDLNSQKVIGNGFSNSPYNKSEITGLTMTLGNRSGFGNTEFESSPNKKLIGAIGVENGKFKTWFKNKTMGIKKLNTLINQHNNGLAISYNNDFKLKIGKERFSFENLSFSDNCNFNTSTHTFLTKNSKKGIVKDGLVCWLDARDGENGNNIWSDRSGNYNDATLYNFNWTKESGFTGKSLKFDGIDDYCSFSVVELLNYYDDVSFEVAFKTKTIDRRSNILTRRANVVTGDGVFFIEKSNLKTWCRTNDSYKELQSKMVSENSIQYCSVVIDKTNKKVFSYINNRVSETPVEILNKRIINSFYIGTNFDASGFFADIELYSIKIYNRTLTEEEIKQNYDYEQSIDRNVPEIIDLNEETKDYCIGNTSDLSDEQRETFRLSVDKTKFVSGVNNIEGMTVETYTYSEIQKMLETDQWKTKEEFTELASIEEIPKEEVKLITLEEKTIEPININDFVNQFEEIGTLLIYEGNLTDEEKEEELSKDIKIPNSNIEAQIPNSDGDDDGYPVNIRFEDVELPIIKNAFYHIKNEDSECLMKIDNEGKIHGDKIEKNYDNTKMVIKNFNTPFDLRIVKSFPFKNDLPDKRIVGMISADSNGFKSWFQDNDIKIKGIENARIVEETEDYQIISDGQVAFIKNYMTGTYDEYLRRIKENENLPKLLNTEEIDHVSLLREINLEFLSQQKDHLNIEDKDDEIKPSRIINLNLVSLPDNSGFNFTEPIKFMERGEYVQFDYYIDGVKQEKFELTSEKTDLIKINNNKIFAFKSGKIKLSTEHSFFTLSINDKLVKEEPCIFTRDTKVIPIPIDFCCRIDKKTGEIYIGEGYENLVQQSNFFSDGASIINWNEDGSFKSKVSKESISYLTFTRRIENNIGEKISVNFEIINNPNNFKRFVPYNEDFDYIGDKDFIKKGKGVGTTKKTPLTYGYLFYLENNNGLNATVTMKACITKTSTPKPFVKTIMPQCKFTLITSATSETHSFIMKNVNWTNSEIYENQRRIYSYDSNWSGDGEFITASKIEVNDKNLNFAISKNGEINSKINQKGFRDKNMLLCNGAYKQSIDKTFKQFIIYKGNLTQEELELENTKDIILNKEPDFVLSKNNIQRNLICWLDFSEGNNNETKLNDRTSNNNFATLKDFVFDKTNGWKNNSLVLKKPGYVIIENNNLISLKKDFTMELTISKLNNVSNNDINASIINFIGYPVQFELAIYKSNIVLRSPFNGILPAITPYTSIAPKTNNKITIQFINNSLDKVIYIYINGQLKIRHDYKIINDQEIIDNSKIKIGGTGHSAVKGELDIDICSFKLYDSCLTEKELKNNVFYELNIPRN